MLHALPRLISLSMKEVKVAEEQSTSSLPFDESVGGKMNVDFIFFSDGRVTKFLHMLMVDILLVIGERDFEVEGLVPIKP